MENDEIVRLLNEAFLHEIENTMTYVRNSFMMQNCDSSRVTEAISIDEMRHMWWLAEVIVKLGGAPTMEHKELNFGGDDLKSMLERQVTLETEAVEMYKRDIELIGDPAITGLLSHILDEEKRHRKEFKDRLAGL